jgi:hypothetical protein
LKPAGGARRNCAGLELLHLGGVFGHDLSPLKRWRDRIPPDLR